MKIIIDLQACQSSSKYRGIGRYSMSFTLALVQELISRQHQVVIGLNASFASEAEFLKVFFKRRFLSVEFLEFSILSPSAAEKAENQWRQMASRLLREHVFASIEPDMVQVSTLMADGWEDDTIASVGMLGLHVPTALTHYDLIPLVLEDIYMPVDSEFRRYYFEKISHLRRADILLAISSYSKNEAVAELAFSTEQVINISSAVNEDFRELSNASRDIGLTLKKYNIPRGFVLYAPGGFDPRKNIDRLLEAYSFLPSSVRINHKLVVASKLPDGLRNGLIWKAGTFGISEDELILTDYVPDDELVDLYRACDLYVFPSLHEGFGLPVLEAMTCEAVVIASNCTSITEAHGLEEGLFNPLDPHSIADKMSIALQDSEFRNLLLAHAKKHPAKFSWGKSAIIASDAMEAAHTHLLNTGWIKPLKRDLPSEERMLEQLTELGLDVRPNASDIAAFHECIRLNKIASEV